MRIGHGYDVHKFSSIKSSGNFIKLGGVNIPNDYQLEAHSDGDVLLHALCDALLGAAALGDIGKHFPDTDKQFRNADSRGLLKKVYQLIQKQQYRISNLDISIIAQSPKMAPHISAMTSILCEDLAIDTEQVNIKATTTEGLGYIGRREGIAVHAVVLLVV